MKSLVVEFFFPEKKEWEFRNNLDSVMAFVDAVVETAEETEMFNGVRHTLIPQHKEVVVAFTDNREAIKARLRESERQERCERDARKKEHYSNARSAH